MKNPDPRARLAAVLLIAGGAAGAAGASEVLVVGGAGANCTEDPQCINRLHPDIPMAATAAPGQTILLRTRNASDADLDPAAPRDPRLDDPGIGAVHPLTGPIRIEGAEAGDVLAVTILDIDPGPWGWTLISRIGFVTDEIPGPLRVVWKLDRKSATTEAIPGVRIPNGSFPGVVTVLPGVAEHAAMLAREEALAEAGGAVMRPHPLHASPAGVCGPEGSKRDECLRTIPRASTAGTWTSAISARASRCTSPARSTVAAWRSATCTTPRATARSPAPRSRWTPTCC